jgi:uncharacterized protein (DUF2141 family)
MMKDSKTTIMGVTISCILLLGSGVLYGQHQVELTVRGIEKVQGSVLIAVYNSEESFMKKHIASKKVTVTGKEVSLVFEDIAPGSYAITTFHDENDNDKLDTNFLGIPNEPYGFSNDARGSFGPPSYEKAKVKVNANKKLVINLK